MRYILNKLQGFINTDTVEVSTYRDDMWKYQTIKLSILEQTEEKLKIAFKNNDAAMVAAIAKVLKSL